MHRTFRRFADGILPGQHPRIRNTLLVATITASTMLVMPVVAGNAVAANPVLAATDTAPSTLRHGTSTTVTIQPSVSSSGGSETMPITATINTTGGIKVLSASGTGWVCSNASGNETCRYTPSVLGVPAGTALPISVGVQALGAVTGSVTNISYTVSSADGGTATATLPITMVQTNPNALRYSTSPLNIAHGATVTEAFDVSAAQPALTLTADAHMRPRRRTPHLPSPRSSRPSPRRRAG